VVFQYEEQLPAFISEKGSDTTSIIHWSTQAPLVGTLLLLWLLPLVDVNESVEAN